MPGLFIRNNYYCRTLFESKPNVFVNQFPYEEILTAKDLLAAIVHLTYAGSQSDDQNKMITKPLWLASTFNLQTELPQFVSFYQNRQNLLVFTFYHLSI